MSGGDRGTIDVVPGVRRARGGVVAAAVAVVITLALSACSAGGAAVGADAEATGSTTTTTHPVPLPGGMVAWTELDRTTVRSMGDLAGTVVVMNDTGAPVEVATCNGMVYLAELVSDTARTEGLWLDCLTITRLPVGESRWPVLVRASYSGCGDGAPSRFGPACDPATKRPPGLPEGEYRAVVTTRDPRLPVPAPVPVRIE